MNILFLQLSRIIWILFRGKTNQAIFVDIYAQRIETRNEYVYSQIIFQLVDQVRVRDIFTGKNTFFFRYLLSIANNSYSSATTSRNWLQNPQTWWFFSGSLILKRIPIFVYEVAHWRNRKNISEFDPHAIHILPKQIFTAKLGRTRKMVRFLVPIQMFDVIRHYVSSPLHIEIGIIWFEHCKSGNLACIHHSVVYMGWIGNLKGHEQMFDHLAGIRSDSLTISCHLHITWILEESCGGSSFERWCQKSHLLRVRLEHRIGKSTLFSFDKGVIQRILLEKFFNFGQSVGFRVQTFLSLWSFLVIFSSFLDIKFDKLAVGELLVRFQVHILHLLTNLKLLFD